ncbi:MAG TPA: DUF488 domain-containing protein [archaeon]|nr:DUF488 domain-containing protein [archaeon]
MLYTKCIFKDVESYDGIRISVMSRHTLNDGVTPDERITSTTYNEWLKELAPPAKLIGDYYKRGLTWPEYETRYRQFLQTPEAASKVNDLASQAIEKDITLLCVEETPEKCHRRLLAEECLVYQPDLKLEHR